MANARRAVLLLTGLVALVLLSGCGSTTDHETARAASPTKGADRSVVVTAVVSRVLSRQARLPADLLAYRDVTIYPKVQGFIDWIGVDRGSVVKRGDLLIKMSAPELFAQTKQNTDQARASLDEADQVQHELSVVNQQLAAAGAKGKASADSYARLKGAASSYAGIIAGNDLEIAEKTAEADAANVAALEAKASALQSQIRSLRNKHKAAVQAAKSTSDIQSYLEIRAAFDGIITERNVHEGSFVHPPAADTASIPLLRLQQLSVLRLVVPVPEVDVSGIMPGASLKFTVSAFPGEAFEGVVRRVAHAVDVNTRTMAVELDVLNHKRQLTPGMFAEVGWPVRRSQRTLFVPQSAVVKTTERTFVIRVKDGTTQWVDVKPGFSSDDLVEVFGDLQAGDEVVAAATDELRAGTHVSTRRAGGRP